MSQKRLILMGVGSLALLLCLLVLGIWLIARTAHAPASTAQKQQTASAQAMPSASLESRILFTGDIYWGRYVNKVSQQNSLKEAFPFSRLHEFDRASYDAWVGNLECPAVPGVQQPYQVEVDSLKFNCPTSYLPEFAKWFTAVSLANNHTANQGGRAGLEATRGALQAQSIQYFGDYDPEQLQDVCEVVSLPARIAQTNGQTEQVKLPVALCGYHGLASTPSDASLALMQQYGKYMPVIAYPHMGVEYTAAPTAAQQALYHKMIDNGADAVLGGHPHWVQPAEAYKNKLIVYSMGNFIFDQKAGETSRGAAIALTLKTAQPIDASELAAWAKLGEECAAYHDTCLQTAEQQQLAKLPLHFSYQAVPADLSGIATHPAEGAVEDAVLQRLNWQAVVSQLP